jgi:hypothetical protein
VRGPTRAAVAGLMIALGCHAVAPGQARAQDRPEPEAASYDQLLHEATNDFDAGAYSEAHALFTRAHKLRPNARTLRALALASFELRHYVQAIGELTEALAEKRKPLTNTQRKQMQDLLERAKSYVGTVQLDVSPSDAVVLLDGQPVTDRRLTLDPGERVVAVRADGYREAEVKLTISGGEDRLVPVQLTRLEPAPEAGEGGAMSAALVGSTPDLTSQPAPEPTSGGHRGAAPWILIGASSAAVVAGGVLLGLSVADTAKVNDAPKGTRWASVAGASDRVPTLSTLGWVMLGVGAAGLASGIVWKLMPEKQESEERASLRLLPGGLELSGAF